MKQLITMLLSIVLLTGYSQTLEKEMFNHYNLRDTTLKKDSLIFNTGSIATYQWSNTKQFELTKPTKPTDFQFRMYFDNENPIFLVLTPTKDTVFVTHHTIQHLVIADRVYKIDEKTQRLKFIRKLNHRYLPYAKRQQSDKQR